VLSAALATDSPAVPRQPQRRGFLQAAVRARPHKRDHSVECFAHRPGSTMILALKGAFKRGQIDSADAITKIFRWLLSSFRPRRNSHRAISDSASWVRREK